MDEGRPRGVYHLCAVNIDCWATLATAPDCGGGGGYGGASQRGRKGVQSQCEMATISPNILSVANGFGRNWAG